MNNILYIDLMNIKNENNTILKSLDKKETFFICQTRTIIKNPFAFNCCEFMTNPNECNYLPPTTIMNSQTTNTNDPDNLNPMIPPTLIIPQTTDISPITKTTFHVDIILVLFSGWKQVGNICSFYIHFTSRTANYIYSTILKVTIIFKFNYKRALRGL